MRAPARCKEERKDAIQRRRVLCPHDAEEVEKILRGVRRISVAAPNSPRLALIRGWKSSRLHRNTLTHNRRRSFVLRWREREVVGGVVSELEEFGGFKGRKTAEQQSNQRDEDELSSHFRDPTARREHLYTMLTLDSTPAERHFAVGHSDETNSSKTNCRRSRSIEGGWL